MPNDLIPTLGSLKVKKGEEMGKQERGKIAAFTGFYKEVHR